MIMNEYWKALSQEMKPRFHEISMYLIGLSFCWLFLFRPEFREGFIMFFSGFGSGSPYFVALGLIETGGLVLCIAHVFINREKLALEKALMGWFVLGVSGVASFFVGAETLNSRSSFMIILVTWNILTSVLLLLQMGMQKYDISDENASSVEIIATTVILFVVLFLADRYFHLTWAMILSVCIFYSTSIVITTIWLVNYIDLHLLNILK
jgi:hypothetical protein